MRWVVGDCADLAILIAHFYTIFSFSSYNFIYWLSICYELKW